MAWAAAVIVLGAVLVGWFFVYRMYQSSPSEQKWEDKKEQATKSSESQSEAVVKGERGITEISLKSAPDVASAPTVEQLKDFLKRSQMLAEQVKEMQESGKSDQLTVGVGGSALPVEPLFTFDVQQKGLVGRESLPQDTGMLYVFQMDDSGRLFGTKGMKFPIDLIWMNNDFTVVHIHKNVPPDFDGDLKSSWPARFVLEVNAGYTDRHEINVGETLDLSKIPH